MTFPVILPDLDEDATIGGDVAVRDAIDDTPIDLDADDDGILDSVEDLNLDGDDDPSKNPTDSHGDLYPDYLDIDSDNDNVPDAIEAHDYDHAGIADVVLIGSDKDDDGLDYMYEGKEEIDIDVNDEIDDLPNTDGDSEVDYRNTDDDDGIETID